MKKDQVKYKISPKGKRKLDFPKKTRSSVKLPLTGKTLYLDVKDVKCTKRLEADLKKLGGTVEEFLSKDINYLITSQPRPKVRRDPEDLSPTPSPFNCDPSPSPGTVDEKKITTTTRGRAIAEKARIQTKTTSTLLDNAEKWGIKIITVEGAFKYINRELQKLPRSPQNSKTNNVKARSGISQYKTFKAPFLKIEAASHAYRPCTSQLEAWPRLNVDTPRGSCPFDGTLIAQEDKSREERGDFLAAQVDISTPDTPQEEKDDILSGARTHTKSVDKTQKKSESDIFASSKLLTVGEIKRQKALKKRQERKRGYCECCRIQYEDLDKHCRDDQHREYVRDKSHFEKLDQFIKTVPSPADFLQREKFKVLASQNKHRKTSQEEDEVDLIPLTPKGKSKEYQTAAAKASPKASKSPAVKGKSPKERNKSALVDLRKLTPLKIVKSPKHVRPVSPKKVSSAKNNSGNSDGSPKVRSQARKVAEMLDVSEKRNTRKSLNEKCDTHSKPFTEKAADEISKGFDDSLKLSRSQKSEEFLQVSQEMQKSPKHITSANNEISEMIVESSVKSIVKSPCRSMQNPASPKLVEHLVVTKSPCVKKSEFKILQNQSAVICNPDSFRKSPSVLESSQSLNEKNPPLSKRLASKSSTKHFQYTASSGKVSLKNNTKSPDKSNKLRNNTHYLSVKNNKENNEERHMRDTRSKPTVEGNGTKLEHMSVTPRRRNRLFTCTDKEQDKDGALGEEHIDDGYIRAKRSVQQKGEKPELNCDKDILCNKESRLADINFCEEFKNSMNKEVDNESRSDDDITKLSHHDAKMTTLESPDTEMEVDKPTSESDKGGNDLPTYNSLDLSALIELGAKKAANPTSSDDFERCLFKAISLGKLNHKHMPEEIQSDRVLRSKKMLDLNEAHLDGQTESATNIASEVIVGKNMDTEASVLETNKAGDGLINETNEQDESTVVLKIHTRGDNGSETHQLTEHEIKLFYQPPDNKETSEFELPLGIQQEVLFTPTLAERVKTRTRLNSVTSYSLSSPVRSRSNSVSSNNSDASAARKSNTLKANVLLNKAKHLLKQHKRAVTGSKHSDTDMSSERDLRTQKSDSVTVPVADETKTTENLDNLRDRNVKGMNSNPAVLNKLVRDDTSRIKSKKTGFKHKNSENSNKRHENRSKKANNELQGLKDYWNDLSSPTVERLRSRTKIIQYDEDSSALTDEYEYSETLAHSELSNQSDSVKYPGIHSDMIVEDAKKTYNAVSDKQTNAPNSVTNIPNLEGDFISWVVDARKDIKKHRPAIQTLESSLTKKITDEIETDMIGDRESPVFNTSPVSKRRKAKHVTKISDQRTDNKEEKESVLLPENERTTAECDIVRMKDSVKEIVSSREKGSKNQSKIRISKAIRNSFTQNFQDFCSDKEVSRPVVTSADLNSSAEIDDSKDEARLSENSVDQSIIPNTPNAKKNVPSGCYGSGYSSTPRSERRKAWKRKNVSSGQNGDHGSHSKKRRKLEKLKFVIEDEKTNFSHGPACAVSETKSPKKHRTKTQNSSGDENLLPDNKNTSDKMSSSLIDEEKNKSRGVVDTERLKIEDLKNISLKWESVSGEKNKVKLNKSWSLLSDRSVSKLLTSEDDRESFHGFTEEEIKADTSLASDMSYEECWEVDKAINSDREFEVDIVEKEPEGLNNKEDFENLVPTFSSPGKRSDSSWFDACEVYIDKSLKNTDESLSVFKGWTSPRKNSVKSPGIEDIYKSPTKSAGTAKLRKQVGSPISKTEIDRMQVDRDIQFNYKSPQKNRHQFSPLKVKNGEIIDRSSPHYKTSTPSRRIKYGKD